MLWSPSTRGFTWVRIPMGLGELGRFPAPWRPRRNGFPCGSGRWRSAFSTPAPISARSLRPFWCRSSPSPSAGSMAFILTGLLTIVWLVVWLIWYRKPRDYPGLGKAELALIESDPVEPQAPSPGRGFCARAKPGLTSCGRFLIDPVWWTFLFWLPDFFSKRYGVDLKNYGPPLVTVYVMADIGSVLGGWSSSRLLKRGVSTQPRPQNRDAGLCPGGNAGGLCDAGIEFMAGGGTDRPSLRRTSGLFRQPLCPALRSVSPLGGGFDCRAGRPVGRFGRHADVQICRQCAADPGAAIRRSLSSPRWPIFWHCWWCTLLFPPMHLLRDLPSGDQA